jgi:hypothetical protein
MFEREKAVIPTMIQIDVFWIQQELLTHSVSKRRGSPLVYFRHDDRAFKFFDESVVARGDWLEVSSLLCTLTIQINIKIRVQSRDLP